MKRNPYPQICPRCGAKIYATITPVRCPRCGKPWSKENPLSARETRFSLRRIEELMSWADDYDKMGKKELGKQCRRKAEGIHEVLYVHGARSEMKKYPQLVLRNPTKRKSIIYAEREPRYMELKPLGTLAMVAGIGVLIAYLMRKKE